MASKNSAQKPAAAKTSKSAFIEAKHARAIQTTMQKSTIRRNDDGVEGQLALDVYQTPNEIVIVAPIAGVKMNDINVIVTEDVLTIKGKRYLEFNIPDEDYLTQECFWGDFSRSIVLPPSADTTKINAAMKDAVLKISIPRTERTKTRLIRIKPE